MYIFDNNDKKPRKKNSKYSSVSKYLQTKTFLFYQSETKIMKMNIYIFSKIQIFGTENTEEKKRGIKKSLDENKLLKLCFKHQE